MELRRQKTPDSKCIKMKLPKVLILNEIFNSHSGGGITLTNLFHGWDSDKIAVCCNSVRLEGELDKNICQTYYSLGSEEYRFIFPFNLFGRKKKSGLIKLTEKEHGYGITVKKHKNNGIRHKFVMGVLFPLLEYTGVMEKITKFKLSGSFCNWLDEFQPDIIYAQAHNVQDIELILSIKTYLNKPLVFHMMDDWPLMITASRFLTKKQLKRNDKAMRMLLAKTDALLSISDAMTDEYKRRYNKDFVPFHNPINLDFWSRYQRKDYELGKSATLLYAGRLGIGIDTSLELIAQAVEMVNHELDIKLKFVIQAKNKPLWISKYSAVEHKTFVEYNDLPKTFSQADFLILPNDFSAKSIQFIGYSMPTKATEYMISGVPIIIFSPAQTALVSYAKKYHWAKIVTENSASILAGALTSLIQNKEERRRLAQTAITVAQEYHSHTKVISEFRSNLTSLANNKIPIR